MTATATAARGNCDDGTALCVGLLATAAPGLPNKHPVSDVILGIAKDVNTRTFIARERLGVGPEEAAIAAETNLTLSTEPEKANVDAYEWMCEQHFWPLLVCSWAASGLPLGH